MAFFDLRFGFLSKNCLYGQILIKNHENPIKLIKTKTFTNLNVGLIGSLSPGSLHFESKSLLQAVWSNSTRKKIHSLKCLSKGVSRARPSSVIRTGTGNDFLGGVSLRFLFSKVSLTCKSLVFCLTFRRVRKISLDKIALVKTSLSTVELDYTACSKLLDSKFRLTGEREHRGVRPF